MDKITSIPPPGTIRNESEFLEALPHSFDGYFHWDYIDAVLRPIRNIHQSDIDSATDVGGLHLHIETSNSKGKFEDKTNGQNRRVLAYLRTGLVTQLDIIGKKIPTQWRWRSREKPDGQWSKPCDDARNEIASWVEGWAKWANSQSSEARDMMALRAAWQNATRAARRQLLEEVTASGDDIQDAANELGRATMDRVKGLLMMTDAERAGHSNGFVGYDKDGRFVHYCFCGKEAGHGHDCFPRQGKLGVWFCSEHNPKKPAPLEQLVAPIAPPAAEEERWRRRAASFVGASLAALQAELRRTEGKEGLPLWYRAGLWRSLDRLVAATAPPVGSKPRVVLYEDERRAFEDWTADRRREQW